MLAMKSTMCALLHVHHLIHELITPPSYLLDCCLTPHYSAQVTTRDFWESYAPAFQACVQEGQAASVMCSYNAMNGGQKCAAVSVARGHL
jgi:hypothetical protein